MNKDEAQQVAQQIAEAFAKGILEALPAGGAITVVPVDLYLPITAEAGGSARVDGVTTRVVQTYDIESDAMLTRIDIALALRTAA